MTSALRPFTSLAETTPYTTNPATASSTTTNAIQRFPITGECDMASQVAQDEFDQDTPIDLWPVDLDAAINAWPVDLDGPIGYELTEAAW